MCGYEFETMGGKFEPLLKMNLTTKEGKSTPGDLSKIRLLFRKKVELTDMLVFYVLDWMCVCVCVCVGGGGGERGVHLITKYALGTIKVDIYIIQSPFSLPS